jgi:hypothetical protein
MKRSTGFTGMRVLAALIGLAIGGPLALAQDASPPSSAMKPELAATSPDAGVTRRECPSEPVSIWYLNNPQAAGGLYNNPWADCKPPATPR